MHGCPVAPAFSERRPLLLQLSERRPLLSQSAQDHTGVGANGCAAERRALREAIGAAIGAAGPSSPIPPPVAAAAPPPARVQGLAAPPPARVLWLATERPPALPTERAMCDSPQRVTLASAISLRSFWFALCAASSSACQCRTVRACHGFVLASVEPGEWDGDGQRGTSTALRARSA